MIRMWIEQHKTTIKAIEQHKKRRYSVHWMNVWIDKYILFQPQFFIPIPKHKKITENLGTKPK